MKEDYASYDLAVALKAAGFDWKCNDGYSVKLRLEPEPSFGAPKTAHSNAPKNFNDNRKGGADGREFYSAPLLSQAQKWLREKKKIDVLVYNCACGYLWEVSKAINGTRLILFDEKGDDENSGCWTTYEGAISAGISAALELLAGKEGEG